MWKRGKLLLKFYYYFLMVFNIQIYFTSSASVKIKSFSHQTSIINAFRGCNIHVINFEGLDVDFEVLVEPIILLRYVSFCNATLLFPIEIRILESSPYKNNISTCDNAKIKRSKLPPEQIANEYVSQTLTESFQLKSKNKIC